MWISVKHTIVKDSKLQETLWQKGWALAGELNPEVLELRRNLYVQNHVISDKKGVVFYRVYAMAQKEGFNG